jgi:nucleoside 2-deoxyribosyltransferase
MPFTEPWSDRVYSKLIRKNVEELGIQCLRADNLRGQIIIEDIWAKINQSAFIIADVTNKNANVMYELGIVHTVGKPTILITQDISQNPFDVSHLRHYSYKDNIDSFETFGNELQSIIKDMYINHYNETI